MDLLGDIGRVALDADRDATLTMILSDLREF
jgi:hypothetical protein